MTPNLVNFSKSGDLMLSSAKLMLSLAPFWLFVMVTLPVVNSGPLNIKLARENHQEKPRSNVIRNRLPGEPLPLGHHARNEAETMKSEGLFSLKSDDDLSSTQLLPKYFNPQLIYKEFIYNKRKRRELREPRKISSSASKSSKMPSYYPFLMAEMIPDSVKTRHPSIIAVTGCPAYYIADHKGQCRQVFQYTVNFGQRSPKSHEPTTTTEAPQDISQPGYDLHPPVNEPEINVPEPPRPKFNPRPINPFRSNRPRRPSRILSLLRNAAKKLDLSILKNKNSSSSGEVKHDEGIDKLRKKILKALKITKDKNSFKKDSKANDNKKKDLISTTPDYDD